MILIAEGDEGMQALYLGGKRVLYNPNGPLDAVSVLCELADAVVKDVYILDIANWYMPETQDRLIPLNTGNKTIKECEEEDIDWVAKTRG